MYIKMLKFKIKHDQYDNKIELDKVQQKDTNC